jgi:tetratricopeptide (TPR) repeat protein
LSLLIEHHFKRKSVELIATVKNGLREKKFGIWCVRQNSPVLRERELGKLAKLADAHRILTSELTLFSRASLIEQLERQAIKNHSELIFVNGFDSSIEELTHYDYFAERLDEFAQEFSRLNASVIFILPEYALITAEKRASQFWKIVNGTVIDFRADIDLHYEVEYNFVQTASLIDELPEVRAERIKRTEEELDLLRENEDSLFSDQIPALLVLALSYFDDHRYEQAYQVYQELSELLPNTNTQKASVLYYIGIILHIWGYTKRAQEMLRESLAIRKTFGDREGIAASQHQLGLVYQNLGEFEKAITSFEGSIVRNQQLGNSDVVSCSVLNLGLIYVELGLHAKAVEKFREAFDLAKARSNFRTMGLTLFYTGCAYLERSVQKDAIKYFIAAKSILEKSASDVALIHYADLVSEKLHEIENQLGNSEYEKTLREIKSGTTRKPVEYV